MRWIYFAQSMPGAPIKIGLSNNPQYRAHVLRCPLTNQPLRVLATLPGDRDSERDFLLRFKSRAMNITSENYAWGLAGTPAPGVRRVEDARGAPTMPREWFVPSPEILACVASIREQLA